MKCDSPLLLSKLQAALDDAQIAVLPAEVHGVLTGLICGGVPMDGKSWQRPFLELVNDGEIAPEPVMAVVKEMYLDVVNSLTDPNMSFAPLLTDNDDPLQDRLEAFINWVQSFLTGLAIMQPALDKASSDIQELIEDLTDFTQVELDVEENDENEEGFAALIEHARIAAWECLREFRGLDDENAPRILH